DLVRKDIPYIAPVAAAVRRYAQGWADGRTPSPAVDDLMHRRAPRIAGHRGGAIAPEGPSFSRALTAAGRGLQSSTLCIQGPPGTRKTHKASEVILELLRDGCLVGVMANSHKAILNLMHAVVRRADEAQEIVQGDDARMRLFKVGGDAEDAEIVAGRITHSKENRSVREIVERREPGRGVLVGGTAWGFSSAPEQSGDVLFVDEAGQVSLANLVAAGLSARNIVLVGDQMQLAQPIQGAHPGESGQSVLDYLLQGRATIPDDFGVFLSTTHRMHPEICSF